MIHDFDNYGRVYKREVSTELGYVAERERDVLFDFTHLQFVIRLFFF